MDDKAIKHDAGKPRVELVSEVALLGLAQVLTHGAEKYAADNWRKGMEWRRLIGSAFRHLLDFSMGIDTDADSGLPSIDHLACCVMFLSEYQKRQLGTDNRYKGKDPHALQESAFELQRRLANLSKLGFSFFASTAPTGGWSWRRKGEESAAFPTLKDALDDAEAS